MKQSLLNLLLLSLILLAALLGIYGESLAYFFEDHLLYIDLLKMLTFTTVMSVSLFLLNFLIFSILLAKQKIKAKVYILLLIINILVGLIVSVRSVFVLAMWWG